VVSLAEILRRHWPAYRQEFALKLLPSYRRAVAAILRCRTAALGGQLYRCPDCAGLHYAYHSCNHRACPQCGHHEATDWIGRQQAHLLPVPYFLVTFTVPGALRPWIRSHQKLWYNALFSHSSGALADIAADPKRLGAQLGFLGVLQTWTRDLRYHPHVHYLVAGGGLSADQLRWVRVADPQFLLPQAVLAARFRSRLKNGLRQHHPQLFAQVPPSVWRQGWITDVTPVGSGQSALKYLSAYIYKTAITAQRLVACDAQSVTFNYRDSQTGQWRLCRLPAQRFLHRFLQHILPAGFQRVRYFGWLAPAARQRRVRIGSLLDWKAPPPPPKVPLAPPLCLVCQVPMILLAQLARAPP
jgi:predicted RNA-binding Zn-ribbon protein involved in translation (DUF1610 family)